MPYVHVLPPSVEVDHPTSALPHPMDPGTRATWKVPTIVFFQEKKSGSTSVLCTLSELWSVSLLIFTRVNCACAGITITTQIAATSITVEKANACRFMRFSSWVRFRVRAIVASSRLPTPGAGDRIKNHDHLCSKGRPCFEGGM